MSTTDNDKKIDMLNGPLLSKLLLFAFPIILGSVLQQLFSAVDTAVVGLTGDTVGQAAIGANTTIIHLFINFFIGISVGINVLVGSYIGQGHKERISRTVHTAITFAFLSGLLMICLIEFVARPLLILMSTPDNVLDQAVLYLRIYAIGMPFILVYNFGAAVLRTIGDTKRPLYALMIAGVVNMVGDYVLTVVAGMGVTGVAIATVFSNVISSMIVIAFLLRTESHVRLDLKKLSIDPGDLKKLLRVGLPAGGQAMVFSIANMTIQSAINIFGSDAIAGNTIALIFEVLSYYVITGFNQAAVTFTSQNYGAGNKKRCLKVFALSMGAALVLTNIVNFTFIFGKHFFCGMFTTDENVLHYAFLRFSVVLVVQFLVCTYEIAGSVIRGFGYSMLPTAITVVGTCLLRVIWIRTVCAGTTDITKVFFVYPLSWIVTGTMMLVAFYVLYRKIKGKGSEREMTA